MAGSGRKTQDRNLWLCQRECMDFARRRNRRTERPNGRNFMKMKSEYISNIASFTLNLQLIKDEP